MEHPDFMYRVTQIAKDHNLDEKNADEAWGPLPYNMVLWETMKRDNPDLFEEYMDVDQFMKLLLNSPKTLEILNKYHFKPDVIGKYYMVIIDWEDMTHEFPGYDTMWRENWKLQNNYLS